MSNPAPCLRRNSFRSRYSGITLSTSFQNASVHAISDRLVERTAHPPSFGAATA